MCPELPNMELLLRPKRLAGGKELHDVIAIQDFDIDGTTPDI